MIFHAEKFVNIVYCAFSFKFTFFGYFFATQSYDIKYSYLVKIITNNTLTWFQVFLSDKIRENGFELTKKRSRRYPAKIITDADYADDIAILANIPNQVETQQHSLERTAAGIGRHVNAYKTEYMCYNQTGDISTLGRTPLKLVDKFTYQGSSVSSTEKDIDPRLPKEWTAIDSYRS